MPRGDNPNSRANLEKHKLQKGLPTKAQRDVQRKGSIEGNKVKSELKTFKELDDEYTTDTERKKMLDALKRKAIQGNLKAYELYRDSMGMKPTEKVEQTNKDIVLNFGDIDKGDAYGDQS